MTDAPEMFARMHEEDRADFIAQTGLDPNNFAAWGPKEAALGRAWSAQRKRDLQLAAARIIREFQQEQGLSDEEVRRQFDDDGIVMPDEWGLDDDAIDAQKWRRLQAEWLIEAARENDPQAFVDRSRDPYAPTHHLFAWDENDEAEASRLAEARRIILRVQEHAPQ